jgi:fluoroquinolone resistance protein
MSNDYTNKKIDKMDAPGHDFSGLEIDRCVFSGCLLSGSAFSGAELTDCDFIDCNLKNIVLKQASVRNLKFIDCAINGVDFGACNNFMFSVSFERCTMDYAGFSKLTMRKTVFKDCLIKEANFIETDLAGSSFDGCDLGRTLFDHANLSGVDFRGAINYSLDPESNNIKKARFSHSGIEGLLVKYDIRVD